MFITAIVSMNQQLLEIFLKTLKVSTDTRQNCEGAIFFALNGPNFDGNRFAAQALEKGARVAVVDNPAYWESPNMILVNNALTALQELATAYRRHLGVPVLAITGSNGKTTTKELLALALGTTLKVHASPGNLNNHIGLPLSILSAPLDTQLLILEMGDNRPGDIETLCRIALPTHGFITNLGKDHIEGYGSIQANIATKAELYDFLANHGGTIFYPESEEVVSKLAQNLPRATPIRDSDLGLSIYTEKGKLGFRYKDNLYITNLIGTYNYANVVAALGIAAFWGCSLQAAAEALITYQPQNMRSQLIEKGSISILLDAYNANPSSVMAALESFATLDTPRRKVAIIGDMLELGEIAAEEHQNIANWFAAHPDIEGLLVGSHFSTCSPPPSVRIFGSKQELVASGLLRQADTFYLLKASRAMKLETLLEEF